MLGAAWEKWSSLRGFQNRGLHGPGVAVTWSRRSTARCRGRFTLGERFAETGSIQSVPGWASLASGFGPHVAFADADNPVLGEACAGRTASETLLAMLAAKLWRSVLEQCHDSEGKVEFRKTVASEWGTPSRGGGAV